MPNRKLYISRASSPTALRALCRNSSDFCLAATRARKSSSRVAAAETLDAGDAPHPKNTPKAPEALIKPMVHATLLNLQIPCCSTRLSSRVWCFPTRQEWDRLVAPAAGSVNQVEYVDQREPSEAIGFRRRLRGVTLRFKGPKPDPTQH